MIAITEMIFEITHVFILPLIMLIAMFVNLICAYIFSKIKFKNNVYRLLKVNSIVDAAMLLTLAIVPYTQSIIVEAYINSYWLRWYQLYMSYYLTRVLSMISSLIHIKIGFDRCVFLLKSPSCLKAKQNSRKLRIYTTIIIFAIVSALFFLPHVLLTDIVQYKQISNSSVVLKHMLKMNDNVLKNKFYLTIMFGIQYMPYILNILILSIFNGILIYYLKKQFKSRYYLLKITFKNQNIGDEDNIEPCEIEVSNNLTSRYDRLKLYKEYTHKKRQVEIKKIEKKYTLMMVWLFSVFISMQIISAIAASSYIFIDSSTIKYKIVNCFFILVSFLCYIANIFIYYLFDKKFNQGFRKLIHKFRTL